MRLHYLVMPIVLVAPLSLGLAVANAQTTSKSTTTTTTTVISTAVPAPKETVPEPAGYVSCTTVSAGWRDKTWVPERKVCRYDTRTATIQGEAYVSGHWECSQYSMMGDKNECTSWDWAAGRWVETYAEVE